MCLLALALATDALAVSPPISDGFETYSSNTTLLGQTAYGWDASSNSVVVLPSNSIPVKAGTNAVTLPVGTTASNLVQSATPTIVWTDVQVNEASHMLDGITVDVNSNAIVQLYMQTNGAVTVFDKTAGQWLSYSTDVWGNAVSSFSAGNWARVSVMENYSTHQAAVFLNGHPLRTQLDFITNRNVCSGFTLQGNADNPVYLDEVQVLTNVPSGFTNDVDSDGMSDAQEIQIYGNVTTWRRWTNTVSATAGGTVSPGAGTTTYTNGTVVNYVFSGNPGYGLGLVQTNGATVSYSGDAKTGSVTWVITADGTFSVSFVPRTQWSVPTDVATLSRAVSVAAAGDVIVASNGLTTAESITLDTALTLTGTNVTLHSTLAVSAGVTATMNTASNWVIDTVQIVNGATLIVTNSTMTFSNLTITGSGVVHVTNGTVIANGLTLTGTFTLDSTFGAAGFNPSHLNFRDDFDLWPVNLRLDALGMVGWGASSAGVVIQSNTAYQGSSGAVILPLRTLVTNTISSVGYSNVWTECAVNESNGMDFFDATEVDSNAVIQLALNTNCNVVLYNRLQGQWQVFSNDFWGASMVGVYSNGFAHIAVNQNYATKKVAVFLNGHLVCMDFDFINTNQGSYASFRLKGSWAGSTYLDSVGFSTNVPTSLLTGPASDLDGDGVPDAVEIAQYGTMSYWPHGSVFKIR